MTKAPEQPILWVDIETNGLDPSEHCLLEVAFILTDKNLCEISRFERIVLPPPPDVVIGIPPRADLVEMAKNKANDFVKEMHTVNGLWEAVEQDGVSLSHSQRDILSWLLRTIKKGRYEKPIIGGASCNFDKSFLEEHMPEIPKLCHYRIMDVSVLKRQMEWWVPSFSSLEEPDKSKPHRAMADIEFTIREAAEIKGAVQSAFEKARSSE